MRTRFRWTRRNYRHAQHLVRLLGSIFIQPEQPPFLVQRYWELWERYPSYGDPLKRPLSYRYDRDDIPF